MGVKITIGGVTRDVARTVPVSCDLPLNERARLTFSCYGTLPSRFAEVIFYDQDETTALFGGIITRRDVKGIVGGDPNPIIGIECGDFLTYANFCYVTKSYTVDTALEDIIDDLVTDHLSDYGISYTPVTTGVTLSAFEWTDRVVSDALRELSDRSGLVFRISPTKELTAFVPGTDSAPQSITSAAPHCKDLTWADPDDMASNSIVLLCGEGQRYTTQSFTATGTDNGITNYVTDYPAADNFADVNGWPNLVYFDGVLANVVAWEPLNPLTQDGGLFEWAWDAANHRMRHDDTTYGPVTAGVVISFGYTIQYPFRVTVDSGASPVIQELIEAPEVFTLGQATELATAKLTQRNQEPKEASILTRDVGFLPGQALTIDLDTTRIVDGSFIITRVAVNASGEGDWNYLLSAVDSSVYLGSYLDKWRALTGGGSFGGGSISSGGSGGGSGAPATGLTSSPVFLGGSIEASLALATAAWTPVYNVVPFIATNTFTGLVRAQVRARNASVSAQVRLYNVTDSTSEGASNTVTSQTLTKITPFLVSIVTGKEYRLEILSGTNNEGVYGNGTLEPF
jgi:hypothetical protein